MAHKFLAFAATLLPLVCSQQVGSKDDHPQLPTWKCTSEGGCVQQQTSVVLDWAFHGIHEEGSSTSCKTSNGGDPNLCPDQATCFENCVIEGTTYASNGVSTSGDAMTLHQYVQRNGEYQNASPRVYLLGPDGRYVNMQLLNQEVSFEVDVSTLVCGENGALYLSDMDATGGRNQYNPGGANFGSGYCDAQCPVLTWRNGTLNTSDRPYCCNEMDLWEANANATAYVAHPCKPESCDSPGCGFNPYRRGLHNFYGRGMTIDTLQPFTVTTRFITDDGTASGTLIDIRRQYIQNGKVIPNPTGDSGSDSITTCPSGEPYGGLEKMGEALGKGMVLAFSIWNDPNGFMNWLDSGSAGPCSSTDGNPADIIANHPDTHVVFSNIRWGDIGTTTESDDSGSGSSTTSSSPATSTTPPGPTQTHWGQCGGSGWSGPTKCSPPYACESVNAWYSQCL